MGMNFRTENWYKTYNKNVCKNFKTAQFSKYFRIINKNTNDKSHFLTFCELL